MKKHIFLLLISLFQYGYAENCSDVQDVKKEARAVFVIPTILGAGHISNRMDRENRGRHERCLAECEHWLGNDPDLQSMNWHRCYDKCMGKI